MTTSINIIKVFLLFSLCLSSVFKALPISPPPVTDEAIIKSLIGKKRLILQRNGHKNIISDYHRQMKIYSSHLSEFQERDLVFHAVRDDLPLIKGEKKQFFLIGKDGEIKFKSNKPFSPKDLFPLIDAMPMRKQEIREKALKKK